jgi:hypothetical protein
MTTPRILAGLTVSLSGLLLAALLTDTTVASAQSAGAEVGSLLRRGTSKVEVLESWSPPRLRALNKRVQRGILSNKDWWRDRVSHLRPGEVMPYDPKLGLTPAEYREFLTLNQDSVLMRPTKTADVVIESTPRGWRFGKATDVEGLRDVEIDTLKNEVHSPFGDLAAAQPVKAGPNQKTTGPWGGPCWKVNSLPDPAGSGSVAQFAVGKLVDTGRTVIYYSARRLDKGKLAAHEDLFLRMVPPQSGAAGQKAP